MIKFRHKGNLSKAIKYFEGLNASDRFNILDRYGREGVAALASATPVDSGLTASSWYYTVDTKDGAASITFHNSNVQNGVPVAIVLHYGHGTRNGGWVKGRNYINPAIQPVFDRILEHVWREVTNK